MSPLQVAVLAESLLPSTKVGWHFPFVLICILQPHTGRVARFMHDASVFIRFAVVQRNGFAAYPAEFGGALGYCD